LESSALSSFTRLGVLESLARVELLSGNFNACEAALDSLAQLAESNLAVSRTYTVRWAAIIRARLMLQRGRHGDAELILQQLESQLHLCDDEPLRAIVSLTMAQALSSDDKAVSQARRILQASEDGLFSFRELQADACRGLAAIIGQSTPFGGRLSARGARIAFQHTDRRPRLSQSAVVQETGPACPAEVINAVAAMFDLAFSPALFLEEATTVLQSVGAKHIRVTRSSADAPSDKAYLSAVSLAVRSTVGECLSLQASLPEDPVKAIMLADVIRIARAALALERYRQEDRNRAALWPADPVETEAGALFLSEEMQDILATARRVATSDIPVLITGETGTGKEVLARLVHAYSQRAKAPFLPFNCTATPKDMLDSQLFGHRRGSFTGAMDNFQGVIRAASGGTLFLDEIGETTLDVQPKLLRFLESSEIHPIGEAHPVRVDVRVIAATNADLEALVAQGRFREDLFYRLDIVRLRLPPLRERRVEIPALANHYLRKHAQEFHKGDLRLAEETMEFLVLYRWPGNIRQLANEMRRMAVLAEKGAVLMPEHLSSDIAASRRTVPASERLLDNNELVVRLDQPLPALVAHVEVASIRRALEQCGGRLEETAAMLGISRKGLYLKRQRYGLDPALGGAAPAAVEFA
jgi:DNA-binding NtrC family response regulator